MNTDGVHSIHGRTPNQTTGLMSARPEIQVSIATGPRDALSVGANQLVHRSSLTQEGRSSARRISRLAEAANASVPWRHPASLRMRVLSRQDSTPGSILEVSLLGYHSMTTPLRFDAGVAIHGGVGTLSPEALTPALEADYRAALAESLEAGRHALDAGGSAMDAVCAAVRIMEDSPLFNAGRGSNFDERGVVSMDASVMDGATQDAGAVADVTGVRYPVDLARALMERSEHLMLTGRGAEIFAQREGLEIQEPAFFHTDRRWAELQRAKEDGGARPNVLGDVDPLSRSGTVGAVARDSKGRLAAATSTGGMANKTWGRVGDSPIIGAGTYASTLCAVSCTGWGEYFIRHAVAHDVHARMAYGAVSLAEATRGVIWDTLEAAVPGSGGLVAVDLHGNVEFCFNTPGMYRGWIDVSGRSDVDIHSAE